MKSLEVYASATSFYTGEVITFFGSSLQANAAFSVEIWRKGATDVKLRSASGFANPAPLPADWIEAGCRWPRIFGLTIPSSWKPGVYAARFTAAGEATSVPFVVKRKTTSKRMLLIWPVATFQAYNTWGGRSLYDFPIIHVQSSPRVTFDRPGLEDVWNPDTWGRLVAWLERYGPPFDQATSIDIHSDPALLGRYRLLLSVWHDEYWSQVMRDNVEAFVKAGGNLCIMSGNTCWWQIRLENQNRTLVCYRADSQAIDPGAQTPGEVTGNWYWSSPGRPEESTTGMSSRFAALASENQNTGFIVRHAGHWAFDNTGLANGSVFGAGEPIVGYETDGVDLPAGMLVHYRENWGSFPQLDGWHDPEDVILAGDFMGRGRDQVLFINRAGGGGRVLIADFSQGPPVRPEYLERWGDFSQLDGWHDPEDLILGGDFMGRGHDQVLFINRTGGGGRVLIADFSQGPPVRTEYLEMWGQSNWLDNGWDDPARGWLAGRFSGNGRDQLYLIDLTKSPIEAKMVDFAANPALNPPQAFNLGYVSAILDGPCAPGNLVIAGWFRGKRTSDDHGVLQPFDQVLFIARRDDGHARGRLLAASLLGSSPWAEYFERWGDSPLLDGWTDPEDVLLAGDFMGKGYDQALFINRAPGGGRLMIASTHRVVPQPPVLRNSVPKDLQVLATADLWHPDWASYDRLFPVGTAVMGIFQMNAAFAGQNRSLVLNFGTTGWNSGLREAAAWNAVSQITVNVLTRLSR